MATILDAITFRVDADTKPFTTSLAGMVTQTKSAAGTMAAGFGKVTKGIGQLATRITAAGGLLGGVAVKGAASFEAAMLRAKTMTDLTTEQAAELNEQVRQLAVQEGVTDFAALGDTVFTAFSSGAKDTAEALELTELALRNLKAQGTDAATTIKFLTQQQKTWKGEAGTNADLMDKLAAAVLKAKDTQEGFVQSLEDVTPLAKASGITVDELFGTIADLSQSLNSAGKASTAFREILNANLTPTKLQSEAIEAMNQSLIDQAGITPDMIEEWGGLEQAAAAFNVQLVKFGKDAIAEAGGLESWLATVSKGMTATDESTRRLVRSVEGFNALLTFADDNARAMGEAVDFVADSGGRFERQYEDAASSFESAFSEAWAAVRELGLQLVIDTGLLDDLKGALKEGITVMQGWMAELRAFISENPDGVEQIKQQVLQWGKWIVGIAGVTTAMAALAPVVLVIKGGIDILVGAWGLLSAAWPVVVAGAKLVGVAIAGLTWPITATIAAVAALATGVVVYWDEIKAATTALVSWVGDGLAEVWGFFEWLADGIAGIGSAIYDSITGWFGDAADWVVAKWDSVADWFADTWLGEAFGFAAGGPVPPGGGAPAGFQHGGIVAGRVGTDVIPARLTRGEFVVNAQATANNRALLEAINSGRQAAVQPPRGGPTELHIHAWGSVDEAAVRERLVPMLERISEAGLSPRVRSVL